MIDPYTDEQSRTNGPNRSADPREELSELFPDSVMHAFAEQEHRMREFIRAHPLTAVFGALALGFVVARTMRETVGR
jgi:hypothetical protein